MIVCVIHTHTDLEWLVFKKQTLAEKSQSYNIGQSVNESKPLFSEKVSFSIFKYKYIYICIHRRIHLQICILTHIVPVRQVKKKLCDSGIKSACLVLPFNTFLSLHGERDQLWQAKSIVVSRPGFENKALCICFNLFVLITMSENLY